ncbi:hypothetical protein D3C79_1094110 [compost metagenome]
MYELSGALERGYAAATEPPEDGVFFESLTKSPAPEHAGVGLDRARGQHAVWLDGLRNGGSGC